MKEKNRVGRLALPPTYQDLPRGAACGAPEGLVGVYSTTVC